MRVMAEKKNAAGLFWLHQFLVSYETKSLPKDEERRGRLEEREDVK